MQKEAQAWINRLKRYFRADELDETDAGDSRRICNIAPALM